MKYIMATEAQRLISISLAKIAASRCIRGGVSLHKNLLVATVLQKARYIFMEEAFHMVHGHYINQANSKFIQQLHHEEQRQLRQNDKEYENDESTSIDDSELDVFSSSIDSNESLNFLHDSKSRETGTMENINCDTNTRHNSSQDSSMNSSELIYLDLDENIKSTASGDRKRRLTDSESNDDSSSFSSKSKQIKISKNKTTSILNKQSERSKISTKITNSSKSGSNIKTISNNSSTYSETNDCLSLDFLSNNLNLDSVNHSRTNYTSVMTPLSMSNSNSTSPSSSTNTASLPISPISSSIDRITSLVSIFNFGNLQRSVSAPDLCSSSSNHSAVDNNCCNLQQRQIAMTV